MIIDTAYIMGDGKVISAEQLLQSIAPFAKEVQKSLDGSTQQDAVDDTKGISQQDEVCPPYDPEHLAKFLDMDEIHFRCVVTKSTDSVGRGYSLEKIDETKDAKKFAEDKAEAEDFISNCNDVDGFTGVLTKAAMDKEGIGWGAIEIVRSLDKKIRRINHIPAKRVRVLKGWTGFVETTDTGKKIYYVPFGQKLLSANRKNPVTDKPAYFDPAKDGSFASAKWSMKSSSDLNKTVSKLSESANEILFIPKFHPKSHYYGVPDIIPAIGSVMGNLNIQDYLLQFFDHNAIPQYAVIIKGAKLTKEVTNLIQHYFSQDIKGQNHKTLIIPLPTGGSEVEIEFKKLAEETKEGSFQQTRKNNQEAIMVSHGVSPAIIGIADAASLGSGKGQSQSENYKNRIVEPSQREWETLITELLFKKGLGIGTVQLLFNSLDLGDHTLVRQNVIEYVRYGIMTINEARKKAGIGPPIKGGDVAFVNMGGMPILVENINAVPASTDAELQELSAKMGEYLGG